MGVTGGKSEEVFGNMHVMMSSGGERSAPDYIAASVEGDAD